jgi:hypothetical protein
MVVLRPALSAVAFVAVAVAVAVNDQVNDHDQVNDYANRGSAFKVARPGSRQEKGRRENSERAFRSAWRYA